MGNEHKPKYRLQIPTCGYRKLRGYSIPRCVPEVGDKPGADPSSGHTPGWVHRGRAQMEVGSSSKKPEVTRDENLCTLQVPEEIPEKGRQHEEIRNLPFDEGVPVMVFKIGTTLMAEHEAILIRVLREYRGIFAWEPKDMPG
ncbi:hypothetical protein LIER_21129 [Lithospermum erythrorhizon]|uniref:Uncharacterized protein n=1 Tax=Lithospermum erythrorhizon TaxID=34254 RepID=A0AAV3QS43_LITER